MLVISDGAVFQETAIDVSAGPLALRSYPGGLQRTKMHLTKMAVK